jgi:hypothetical protein
MAECASNFTLSCVRSGVDPTAVAAGDPPGPASGVAPPGIISPALVTGTSPTTTISTGVVDAGSPLGDLPVRPRAKSF